VRIIIIKGGAIMTKSNKREMPNKPLTALAVRLHKEGFLVDAPPHGGLRLKANKSGSKAWSYRYKVSDKKLRQIKLGGYPLMDLAAARAALMEQKAVRDAGGDPRELTLMKKQKIVKVRIPGHAEHRFRKMNKSVHLPPESVFIMNRNGCSSSIGIGVQHGPEYAAELT
jgi:hypothetical protein